VPSVKTGSKNFKNPYPPSFNNNPARITEPEVGASTCASGNQMWKGKVGVFTENAIYENNHKTNCFSNAIVFKLKIKKLVFPISKYSTSIVKNNNTEPTKV